MGETNVFQSQAELERLRLQSQILWEQEQPVFRRLLAGRRGLRVLDVGCNDGYKTMERFGSVPEVAQIVGVEAQEELVESARRQFPSATFLRCDIEHEDLDVIPTQSGVEAFDIIYLSCVLMHLADPGALLRQLHPLLAPGGCLLIVDFDDAITRVEPEGAELLQAFLEIQSHDPWGGDRHCGAKLPALLAACGYGDVIVESDRITAGPGQPERKRSLYDFFFTFLPQDIPLLLEREPDNPDYLRWQAWMDANLAPLQKYLLAPRSRLSVGVIVISCRK